MATSAVYLHITEHTTSITAAAPAYAQQSTPAVKVNPLRDAYYGDLHLHTGYSFDAFALDSGITPDDAYRFARGESVNFFGKEVKCSTPPLDFLAVTDHAENIGVLNTLDDPNSPLSQSGFGRQVRKEGIKVVGKIVVQLFDGVKHLSSVADVKIETVNTAAQTAWQREIAFANRNYVPGKFTTFIGYEWTSQPGMQNLHRNVIFRGDKAPNPFTAYNSQRPEDLWGWLEKIRKQGYEALAIPHNANASNGLMFDWVDSAGKPIDQAYAEERVANEPLVEIVQQKGQSETHPSLSPNDEFSNFEIMDFERAFRKDNSSKLGGSYVRDALGRGMEVAQRAGGVNPFKYGFVGASDIHTGLSESSENAQAETYVKESVRQLTERQKALSEGTAEQLKAILPSETATFVNRYEMGSPGLTGVWAEENTRESIFAALRRKETFATSGTRLKLRFFGGWEYGSGLLKEVAWVKAAYSGGVPMGGDLPPQPTGKKAPKFAMWAVKDPNDANLDRLQVVKVWLDNGKHFEKVYDVALSNGRKVDPETGKAPSVGNTVDPRTATYTNTIGATELSAVWQDPQFDPKAPAVYYLRVLEIPTPRWSTIDAVKRGQPLPEGVPGTIQERGWSSPIWYTPQDR
ncbi:MAG: DUF3604 domain-containing protein [Acidobacteria bacterium]|nr:DUF3604 domain-containing protein [Acidobacteriota bacterium]